MFGNQKRPTFLREAVKVVVSSVTAIRAVHYTFELADDKAGFDRRIID